DDEALGGLVDIDVALEVVGGPAAAAHGLQVCGHTGSSQRALGGWSVHVGDAVVEDHTLQLGERDEPLHAGRHGQAHMLLTIGQVPRGDSSVLGPSPTAHGRLLDVGTLLAHELDLLLCRAPGVHLDRRPHLGHRRGPTGSEQVVTLPQDAAHLVVDGAGVGQGCLHAGRVPVVGDVLAVVHRRDVGATVVAEVGAHRPAVTDTVAVVLVVEDDLMVV